MNSFRPTKIHRSNLRRPLSKEKRLPASKALFSLLGVFVTVAVPALNSQAQTTLLGYPSANNDQTTTGVAPTTTATGVTGTNLLRGSGLTAASKTGFTESSTDGRTTTSTFASSVTTSAGKYYTFTVAPAANYSLSFTKITAAGAASSTGPTNAQWGYSINNFSAGLGTASTLTTGGATTSATLTDTGVTTATEFRFVGFRPSTAGGNQGSFQIDAPALTGTATLRAATTLTWDGGQGSASWSAYNATASDQSNWNGNNIPLNGDALAFAGTTQLTTTNDVSGLTNIASITFNSGAGSFTVGGNALTINSGGITNNSTSAQAVNLPLTLGAAQTFNAASGTMTFGGTIATAGYTLTIDGASNTVFNGAISGTGSLIKNGSGSTTLGVANGFSGTFTANAGTTILSVNNALSSVSAINITSGALVTTPVGLTNAINDAAAVTVNGNLDLSGGTETVGSLSGTNTGGFLTIGKSSTNNGGFTVGDGTSTTFAGVIRDGAAGTGTGYFTKQGSGRLTLTNTNTFTGTVNVNGGTLAASNTGGAAALGSVTAVNVGSGGTLLFGATNQVNSAAPIALGTSGGSGAAVINANTFSQGTTTSQGLGALTLRNTASLDFGTVSSSGNSVVMHFGDSSANTWTTGVVLSVLDYAGTVLDQTGVPVVVLTTINSDDLQFGLTATSLTATQVGQIQFVNPVGADGTQYTGTFGAAIGANGQVFAVVPEPATVLGGVLLVGALGWNQRRRLGGLAGLLRQARAA